jgi:CsoR family transcriptional regulator, copper-sensing transcriptional repressor
MTGDDTNSATAQHCGCGVRGTESGDAPLARRAVGVDPDIKRRNLARLKRIEGQVRGLHKMVEEDRYCADILTQISSAQEALRAVSRELMRNHLKHCASAAIRAGEGESMYDELIDLMYTHAR